MADETAPPEDSIEPDTATDDDVTPEEPAGDGDATDAQPPGLDETEQDLLDRLERDLGDGMVEHADSYGTLVVRVRPDAWRRAAEVSKQALECDYLSFVAGLDWQPAPREGDEAGGDTSAPVQPTEMTFGVAGSEGRFQVFAHVQSTAKHWGVTFKTDVDEAEPRVESWVSVYAGADWHERECWEMYGFIFDGHPALRHLYLPSEFEGHPLRKDYQLLARAVKPWPGLVDVEAMPGDDTPAEGEAVTEEASDD